MKTKLFSNTDVQHTVHRSGYDLSEKVNFTAKAGELLPVYHRTVMPGDNFKINPKLFTRTAPSISCPFTQIKEYVDFFFVPYRQLWRNAPQVFTKNTQNSLSASSPYQGIAVSDKGAYFSFNTLFNGLNENNPLKLLHLSTNQFGYRRSYLAAKLLSYLGYSYISKQTVDKIADGENLQNSNLPNQLSAFPLLAYHKIYNDFFRNSRWENSAPYNFNIDYSANGAIYFPNQGHPYWAGPTLFDLHYASFPKDIFFGMLPSSQLGEDVVLSTLDNDATKVSEIYAGNATASVGTTSSGNNKFLNTTANAGAALNARVGDIADKLSGQLRYLDIRQAQFLQHYKEVVGSGNLDYPTIIKKIFGYDVNESLTGNVQYLGGNTNSIQFNEQVNANLGADGLPEIKATGKGSSNDEYIDFTAPEHGIIMAIYHAMPVVDYATDGFHFDITKVSVDDYANPAFDTLGFQQMRSVNFYTGIETKDTPSGSLGFNVRFADYKSGFDRVLGDFRETQKQWLAPVNLDYLKDHMTSGKVINIDATTFQCDPSILDPIFSVKAGSGVASDQFLCQLNLDIQAVRCLDRTGMPKDF